MKNIIEILKRIKILRYIYHYPKSIYIYNKDKKLIEILRKKVKNPPEKIKQFRNMHKGKRCFIVCNGPSLAIEDLEKLKNEYTFSSNRIYKMFLYTKWRPTYYCEADPYISKVIELQEMQEIINCKCICFLNLRCCDDYPKGTKENDNVFFYYIKPMTGIESIKNEKQLPDFSRDFSEYAYSGTTITYEMLQLAIYMGFNEIYLIGCDNNYRHTIENNKFEENINIKKNYPKEMGEVDERIPIPTFNPKSTLAYEAAKQFAEKNGIKIYNATRGGRLEVFERVDFDEIIKTGGKTK